MANHPLCIIKSRLVPAESRRWSVARSFLMRLLRPVTTALLSAALAGCSALTGFLQSGQSLDAPDFKSRIYAGAAIGATSLSPGTGSTGFRASSGNEIGTQFRVGFDLTSRVALEFDTSILGTVTMMGSPAEVQYSSAAFTTLIYGKNSLQLPFANHKLEYYGRLGAGYLSKASSIVPLDDRGIVPIIGAGAEYGLNNGLSLRAEMTRFDSDAIYAGFGAVFRFGAGSQIDSILGPLVGRPGEQDQKNEAEEDMGTVVEYYAGPDARQWSNNGKDPHYRHTVEEREKVAFSASMSERWRPAMRPDDSDADGVLDSLDRCKGTDANITVDRYGCGLFDAVLNDVTFKSGSAWLSPKARGQLDLLAEMLLMFPESRVLIRAHTDSRGSKKSNMALSAHRAEVVTLYLQSRGVHDLQLRHTGMGESQPIDTNDTATGRRHNRRVDVVTLPDRDAESPTGIEGDKARGQLLVKQSVSAANAAVPVGSDQWNTGRWKKRDHSRNGEPEDKPVTGIEREETLPDATLPDESIPDATVPDVAEEPALLAALPPESRAIVTKPRPLPRPGRSDDFPVTGVIEGLNFENGKSKLNRSAKAALDPLLAALEEHESVRIAVMAHTDNRGKARDNKRLSVARAHAVVNYLADRGIDRQRLKPEGYGEMLPLVQNFTAEDKARNRRIEIRILPGVQ